MSIISMPLLVPANKLTDHNFCSFRRKHFKPFSASFSAVASVGVINCSSRVGAEPCHQNPIPRRSGNYKPPLWDFDYVQSLKSEYLGERYLTRASELKEQVSMMLNRAFVMDPVDLLEFIDDLHQLGISYHFEDKIKQILITIYNQKYLKNDIVPKNSDDLYTTALKFRLLRQHGFIVPQEIFNRFKNEKAEFKPSLGNDTKGLLQLYEASYMLTEGEDTLEMARDFATRFLQKYLDSDQGYDPIDQNLLLMVRSALEVPLHWRIERLNAKQFIYGYERRPIKDLFLLEFAKLDFNIVQATYIEELKHVSRWWKKTCLAEKLPFARDRLVECYFWTTGVLSNPQYGYARIIYTKVNALITIIDDVYDVYGTLEELNLFTNAIQRWDIKTIDQLPNYMKICYLALNNCINETAYDVLKDQGFFIVPCLRKLVRLNHFKKWTDLCTAYLQEAKWYFQGYTPTLEEYIKNACISIAAPVILSHIFFAVANPIEEEAVNCLYKYHDILLRSAMILRLADDLGTSPEEMKRGDVAKSIQCYMNETGAVEEDAQEYVRFLLREAWKKMNEELVAKSPFPRSFIRSAANLGRMAQYMYQHGDGHGISNPEMKSRISTSLFEPIT